MRDLRIGGPACMSANLLQTWKDSVAFSMYETGLIMHGQNQIEKEQQVMTSISWLKRVLNGTNLPISYGKQPRKQSQYCGRTLAPLSDLPLKTIGPQSRKNIMLLLDWCCSIFLAQDLCTSCSSFAFLSAVMPLGVRSQITNNYLRRKQQPIFQQLIKQSYF